jgi:hypothetical protein
VRILHTLNNISDVPVANPPSAPEPGAYLYEKYAGIDIHPRDAFDALNQFGATTLFTAGPALVREMAQAEAAAARAAAAGEAIGCEVANAEADSMLARLRSLLDDAIERFDEDGFTRAQAGRLSTNPELEPLFRGERIHTFFQEYVAEDPFLMEQGIQVTPRFQFGPDVYDAVNNFWWDVTTPDQWYLHVGKYSPVFGQGTPLFYPR